MKAATARPSKPSPAESYEQLFEFNQRCAGVLDLLNVFASKHMMPLLDCRYYQVLIEETRAAISQAVMEAMDQREISAAATASGKRRYLERQMLK